MSRATVLIAKVDHPSPSFRLNHPGAAQILGIFAKAPVPGRVKTRLSPPLTPAECAAFHEAALRDTLATFGELDPVIFYAGEVDYFLENFPERTLVDQGEGDLGERMARALAWFYARGVERTMLIGSDSPELSLSVVAEAYAALATADVAAVPAGDGGYVLIGTRGVHPEIFSGVAWSTAAVMQQTRDSCLEHGLVLAEIGSGEDVDDYSDLIRLAGRSLQSESGRLASSMVERYGRGDLSARSCR